MELRQLKYFATVTKLSQITKAAVELNISQPSLSAQIKLLEEELDNKLFNRLQRQVILTEPGKVLYKHALMIFQQLEDCKKELEDLKALKKGKIVIGSLPTIIVSWLPNIINSFKQKYENIDIEVRDMHTPEIIRSMENYEVELGLVTYPLDQNIFRTLPFLQEELVLIVPSNHRFSHKSSMKMVELSEEAFILYKKDTQSRYTVIEACKKAGFAPNIAFENNRVEIIISFVSSGLGVAFVPKESLNFAKNYKVSVIPVQNPVPLRTICLATLKKRYTSDAAKIFQSHLLSHFDIESKSFKKEIDVEQNTVL